ncbi:DNA end-binding protein Ku [Kribbella orskensis]|uniref:Non-homologous end joining protein Ku n=1 Tax=Kribbella orskensis TaxID=2512216 RepID=A0ABY2BUY9_9ACTN|nr:MULTISPECIES: Ku protein [Kribbella]TCN44333.1 DNA end-binding protein Ku [Kribbella sp. VKM Ac-2500]TCO31889.1 DNA end-binding protein Ku [Kribbella orskensis]
MQAIWKGAISFGMVTIPIKVFSATEEKDISFRQVHVADGGRIRYKRVCQECGEEVPYSDIGKGYEMADGRMVVLEPEDFADLPLSSKKVIDVLEFVPSDQVDPLYLGKSYYLAADGGPGAKPYVLLRDALEGSELYALVKVALRSRESLGLLRTHDNVLVLQVMLWPDEVRDSSFAAPSEDVEIRKQEKAMAESYIDTLRGEFDPDQYHDEYRQALEQVVDAKAAGVPIPEAEEEETEGAEVVDLVAALRASVEAAKARRAGGGSGGGGKGDAEEKPAAKKSAPAARKAPAKKAAAKKAPAKKTAAKKAAKKSA